MYHSYGAPQSCPKPTKDVAILALFCFVKIEKLQEATISISTEHIDNTMS